MFRAWKHSLAFSPFLILLIGLQAGRQRSRSVAVIPYVSGVSTCSRTNPHNLPGWPAPRDPTAMACFHSFADPFPVLLASVKATTLPKTYWSPYGPHSLSPLQLKWNTILLLSIYGARFYRHEYEKPLRRNFAS